VRREVISSLPDEGLTKLADGETISPMRQGLWVVVCLVAGTACQDGTPSVIEGQPEAEALVWYGVYKRTDSPPPVIWREPDCAGGIQIEGGVCTGGVYRLGGYIVIAKHPRWSIAMTTYSHELMHAIAHRDLDDADPLHFRAPWGLVEDAEQALRELD
jgi:hypothetical protein